MLCNFLFSLLALNTFAADKTFVFEPLKQTIEGKFVDQKDSKKVLFLFKGTPHIEGTDVHTERLYICPDTRVDQCPDGRIAAKEDVFYRNGKAFMMNTEHYQAKWNGSVVVSGNKIKFSYIENGKKIEEEETLKYPVLFSEEIIPYILKNWDSLMNDKTQDFRLPVVFRQETVGFKVFKDRTDGNMTVFSMKPTSIFIAAIVKPIYFYFETATKRPAKVDGRTTPKIIEKDKVSDLDAVLLL